MGQYVVRGVPTSILQDSWWIGSGDEPKPKNAKAEKQATGKAIGLLLVLVVLADFLFFGHSVGVSLAVYTVAVAGAVVSLMPRHPRVLGPAGLLFLSVLPVVEYVQTLSVIMLLVGAVTSLCWAVCGYRDAASVRRFLVLVPQLGIRDLFWAAQTAPAFAEDKAEKTRFWRSWAFPTGGALVLASLLISANPILSDLINQVWRFDFRIERALFWIGVAVFVWPVLAVSTRPGLLATKQGPRRQRMVPRLGLNAQSVGNALVLFNLLLGVQTVLDITYLWGGAKLPEGMSHAEYAHRGAYPLVLTALLAGGFALAARPFLDQRGGLKHWMAAWLAQNVLLVVSSLLRLSLYVEAYGLTYLRVHAAIWMGLVAAGLCLTGWQILRRKSNRWLMIRSAALGVGVLYACCFVNFAALIARENLRHSERYDEYYVCQLGPMAAAEIAASPRPVGCRLSAPKIDTWREWGFRADRVLRSLKVERNAESGYENTRRR